MIGLDSNVLVRFFMQDDVAQSRRANRLMQSLTPDVPGFVSVVSLIELIWVLRSQYLLSKAQLVVCVERLLDSSELTMESQSAVAEAMRRFAGMKCDFADCLIGQLGHAAGCTETVTFDVRASKLAGMRLL